MATHFTALGLESRYGMTSSSPAAPTRVLCNVFEANATLHQPNVPILQNVVLQLAFRTSKPAAEDCAADSTLGTNRNGQESQCCPPPSAFRLILTAGAGALGRCSPGLEMELRLRWAVRSRLLCKAEEEASESVGRCRRQDAQECTAAVDVGCTVVYRLRSAGDDAHVSTQEWKGFPVQFLRRWHSASGRADCGESVALEHVT